MALQIHKSVHKIINRDGRSLWLPASIVGGRVRFGEPNIFAQSSSQIFPVGTKLEYADGRVFRYGQFLETSTTPPMARLLCNASLVGGSASTYSYEGTLDATSDYAVGSTKLILNDTTDRAENYYEDAMLAVYPATAYHEYRVAGNEAASSVDDVTIYLSDPEGLVEALVVNSTGVTIYPSIYRNMAYNDATGYESAVGMYLGMTMTATYYAWVQTWGRCIITPTAYFGDSANERLAMMWSDSTIATAATADPSSGYQIVGYLSQRTVSGYGDLEVMLQLGR
jgi:hypothetical protein